VAKKGVCLEENPTLLRLTPLTTLSTRDSNAEASEPLSSKKGLIDKTGSDEEQRESDAVDGRERTRLRSEERAVGPWEQKRLTMSKHRRGLLLVRRFRSRKWPMAGNGVC
jgi:hypothetical protein